jgi:membrane protease YdiL (CAAX protease family)
MHDGAEVLVPIVTVTGAFAMVFGIVYLRTRQNLAMIEKGMNPKEFANRPAPYKNLKWALLFIGAGVGLFLAYILDTYILQHTPVTKEIIDGNTYHHGDNGNEAIYFSLIAIGAGLGLFGSYRIEKKWWDENKGKE